ncbi:TonB-dependent receptor [Halioxenophilus aromaticivorans]|uniref:TonB-dependent receptor n=1 Tax=Halioxenophilus aromaticivorans TaxID=1306992 RepID=A0AAV3U481_9ALTE
MRLTQHTLSRCISAISIGVCALPGYSLAQEDTPESQAAVLEEVTVTGFRGSLSKALDQKRDAVNVRESIMAEDIGKFPDLNIAEAIQRVPGVAISREGGEGRQITLRGFGPQFTRATLNGMEVPASTDGLDSGGGINSGRSFDFNVFASELFNRVDIQKTTTASMEEGGIAGTVDLYSAKPFDYSGFKSSLSVQDGYNSLTSEHDPRAAFLVSNTFADDKLGALLSVAYSERTVRQEGFGTVRWTTPVITGNTYPDTATPVINGDIAESNCALDGAAVAPINCLWAPRLPRADFFGNEQQRLGVTASFQFRPNDNAEITLDVLHSKLENQRENYNSMEWFLTHNEVTPLEITVHPNGKQILAATFDDVESWIESRVQNSETDFQQYVLSGEFLLTDQLTLNAMIGSASSEAYREEFRFYYVSDSHIYSYDFSGNGDVPRVSFGPDNYDYYDAANYEARPAAIRSHDVERDNLTSKIDLTYEQDQFTFKAGFAYNDREVEFRQGNGEYPDAISAVGYTTDFPYSDFGTGLDGGSLVSFPVADFNALFSDVLSRNFTNDLGSNWIVDEETLAAYLEFTSSFDIGSMMLRTNFGVRYVASDSTSTGYLNGQAVSVDHSYNNFLPSMNFALEVTEDVTTRLAFGRSMTRPSLNSLNIANPNFTYETRTASLGNPELDPYVSNDMDFSAEWYFAEESLLAATYFYKDVETSLTTNIVDKLVDQAYWEAIYSDPRYDASYGSDPAQVPYTHYIPENDTEGFTVKGYELVYQQPFTFLPGWMQNFGLVVNYTHVSAGDMTGLSESSYNTTLYYETDTFGGRLSVNSRDDYVLAAPGGNGHEEEIKYGPTHVDFSSFWNLNEQLTFTFEIINLTDEEERIYGTGDGTLALTREYNHTGRQYFLGARYTF